MQLRAKSRSSQLLSPPASAQSGHSALTASIDWSLSSVHGASQLVSFTGAAGAEPDPDPDPETPEPEPTTTGSGFGVSLSAFLPQAARARPRTRTTIACD